MPFKSWLNTLVTQESLTRRSRKHCARKAGGQSPRLLERLEDPCLLTVLTVNTLADDAIADNFLSLREAINAVNAGDASGLSVAEQSQVTGTFGSSDTILFDSSVTGTITLGGSELLLTADISITGPGASSLAVSGNNASRMFEVNAGVTASIARLTIQDGKAGYYNGGGVDNIFGTLTLTDSTVSGNTTIFGSGGIDNQDRRIQT